MAFKGKIPARVDIRVKERWGCFYVLARNRKGWEVLDKRETKGEALEFIEQYHTDKDKKWSMDVRMRDFFACIGCGERERRLLESHHIQPKEQFPELRHALDNGETDCLWRHAFMHRDNPAVMNMILLRLVRFLTERLYPQFSKCQRELLDETNA